MSQFKYQDQTAPVYAYPPPPLSSAPAGVVVAAPPPVGYPTKDNDGQLQYSQNPPPVETQSRGDGFWKGCCAALCCCCLLDACF